MEEGGTECLGMTAGRTLIEEVEAEEEVEIEDLDHHLPSTVPNLTLLTLVDRWLASFPRRSFTSSVSCLVLRSLMVHFSFSSLLVPKS